MSDEPEFTAVVAEDAPEDNNTGVDDAAGEGQEVLASDQPTQTAQQAADASIGAKLFKKISLIFKAALLRSTDAKVIKDLDFVKEKNLIPAYFDLNQLFGKSGGQTTMLHCAVTAGRTVLVDWLLTNGASVVVANDAGETPLHVAVDTVRIGKGREVFRTLLEAGARVDTPDTAGETVSDRAARLGIDLGKVLGTTGGPSQAGSVAVSRRASVAGDSDVKPSDKPSAAAGGKPAAASDGAAAAPEDDSPAAIEARKKQLQADIKFAKILMKSLSTEFEDLVKARDDAARRDGLERALLSRLADENQARAVADKAMHDKPFGPEDRVFLHYAAEARCALVTYALLRAKANPNKQDSVGDTALHLAARAAGADGGAGPGAADAARVVEVLLADSRTDPALRSYMTGESALDAVGDPARAAQLKAMDRGKELKIRVARMVAERGVTQEQSVAVSAAAAKAAAAQQAVTDETARQQKLISDNTLSVDDVSVVPKLVFLGPALCDTYGVAPPPATGPSAGPDASTSGAAGGASAGAAGGAGAGGVGPGSRRPSLHARKVPVYGKRASYLAGAGSRLAPPGAAGGAGTASGAGGPGSGAGAGPGAAGGHAPPFRRPPSSGAALRSASPMPGAAGSAGPGGPAGMAIGPGTGASKRGSVTSIPGLPAGPVAAVRVAHVNDAVGMLYASATAALAPEEPLDILRAYAAFRSLSPAAAPLAPAALESISEAVGPLTSAAAFRSCMQAFTIATARAASVNWDFAFFDFHGSAVPGGALSASVAGPTTSAAHPLFAGIGAAEAALPLGVSGGSHASLGFVPARYSELLTAVSAVDRGVSYLDRSAAAVRVAEKKAQMERKKAAKDPAAAAVDTTVAPQPYGCLGDDTGAQQMRYGETYAGVTRGEDILEELKGLGFVYPV